MTVAANVLGVTPTDLVIVVAVVGYIVSLIKDWRPMRTLRTENRDLRQMLEKAEAKISSLEAQVALLQKATDLTSLVEEHKKIADVLARVVAKLDDLDGSVHANTAAVAAIASSSALKKAIDDMEGRQ